ncbi:dihydropteroate synthase [Mangrovibacillus cuniculi]|uniref:Dihydropteroate synthase n=1 Tax=Mangrovibacillus cuniculi TaxID=2593652 RepID=A0A7S8CDI7_9BACI|nr:dihydropteroate synthase [Mangrovibacillus cuniculi]QPC48000.1 dihydropteroate synthase [Mangrovibacillus cuniculi]
MREQTKKVLEANRTLIMGIVNVTPDSFSDGGRYTNKDTLLKKVDELIRDGADVIDVGGESTRPGATSISRDEELSRVIPAIESIRSNFEIPISIDTYKAEVARQSILAGADLINDVWGAKKDPMMAGVAAGLTVPIILMHNRERKEYQNFLEEYIADIQESIVTAKNAGVKEEFIWLDPGVGFAKTHEQNLLVLNHLDKLVELGYPVLLGTSRKSVIGHVLDLPVEERLEGTLATNCFGITKGCKMVRVHDVKEMKRAAKMTDAMMRVGDMIG